jgi:phospholipid/cholesterol/gamma-HCH transport system permease protein
MRSTIPYDPRASHAPEASLTGQLGRRVVLYRRNVEGLLQTLGGAVLAAFTPGIAARRVVRRVLLTQILYTGFQAVGLISAIGGLLGATIAIQTELMVPSADSNLIGKVLVAVVYASSLRCSRPSSSVDAREPPSRRSSATCRSIARSSRFRRSGIDPMRFIVQPRLVSAAVSVVVLMVYFCAVALLSTAGIGMLVNEAGWQSLHAAVRQALTPYDLGLFLVKGVGLGTLVGWLSCHYGLGVKSSPTEVPQMASRAVVMSLLGCVMFNTLVTAVFYLTVGPPLR